MCYFICYSKEAATDYNEAYNLLDKHDKVRLTYTYISNVYAVIAFIYIIIYI